MTSESQKNKDLARELRATHFSLGNNAKNPFLTVSQKDYPQKSANSHQNHEEKLADLRGAHFSIGNSQPISNNYITTNTALYPQHQNYQPSYLNEEKRKDLRSHHFSLGKTDGATKSHSHNVFKEHPVCANNQDLQDARTRMRSNHHNFKETNTKYMSTLYNQQYNKEFDKKDLAQGYTKEQLMNRVVQLRSSHIVFGNNNIPMKTLQQQSYNQKENSQFQRHYSDFQATHINLGQQKPDFTTTNSDFHQPLPSVNTQIDKELIKNLQMTHWTMGQDRPSLNSEFKMQYKSQSLLKPEENQINTAKLQENHFSLGDPAANNAFCSQYSRTMKPYKNFEQAKPVIEKNKSNFSIGSQGNNYISDFQANFQKPPSNCQKATLNDAVKDNLQSSHFKFSDVKNNLFNSTQKASFQIQPVKKTELAHDVQKLRSTHFTLGENRQDYCTEFQAKYTKKDRDPSTFNQSQLENLRETHLILG